jgi:hypothetical protein
LPRATPFLESIADPYGTAGPTGSLTLRVATGEEPALAATVDVDLLRLERLDAGHGQACGLVGSTLWCWGAGLPGLLLLPGGETATRPVRITAMPAVIDVAVSEAALCALDAAGVARCSSWSSGRSFVAVQDAPPLQDLKDAGVLFCGRSTDSTAWCWTTRDAGAFTARQVSSTLRFTQLAGGESGFACGRTAAGAAWCWGRNRDGQLGNGTTDSSATPVAVIGALALRDVTASGNGACGITMDESVWCWGALVSTGVPVQVPLPSGSWPRLAGGWREHYALGLRTTFSWFKQEANVPDPITEALPVLDFSAEDGQKCVIVAVTGEVFCSWILVHGGSESRLYPSVLVPVPAP